MFYADRGWVRRLGLAVNPAYSEDLIELITEVCYNTRPSSKGETALPSATVLPINRIVLQICGRV